MAVLAEKQKFSLEANARTVLGRAVKRVRAEGLIPAVVYGKGHEARAIQVPRKSFETLYQSAGESSLVYLSIDGEQEIPTIIHATALDPLSDELIHADFYQVRLDEAIRSDIPVVFTGESPAVKDLKGIFVRNINELEVEALPQDLPHEILVDISSLKRFDDHILVKDLNLGDKVKVLAEPDEMIATVQEPMSEEAFKADLEGPAVDVSAVEEIEKQKEEGEDESGETPAAEGGGEQAPDGPAKE